MREIRRCKVAPGCHVLPQATLYTYLLMVGHPRRKAKVVYLIMPLKEKERKSLTGIVEMTAFAAHRVNAISFSLASLTLSVPSYTTLW